VSLENAVDGQDSDTRLMRRIMARNALMHLPELDGLSVLRLQAAGMFEKLKAPKIPDAAIEAIANPTDPARYGQLVGPFVFFRDEVDARKHFSLDVSLIFSSASAHNRSTATAHYRDLATDLDAMLPSTCNLITTQFDAVASEDPKVWRPASILIMTALQSDILLNARGIAQCIEAKFDEEVNAILRKVLRPESQTLATMHFPAWRPSERKDGASARLLRCADATSLSDACGRYLNELGHLPLGEDLGMVGLSAIAQTDQPRDHQFAVGVDRGPSPDIAVAKLTLLVGRDVLRLGIAEGPNLIALNPLAGDAANMLIVVLLAGRTDVHQQFGDRVLCHASYAAGCADRATLDQRRNHPNPISLA
jgi:hypothetical protein